MKYDFLSIGGMTEDLVFFTDEGILLDNKDDILRQKLLAFEYGAKINSQNLFSYFGGGASNTAVNFAGLGFRVACLANLGKDERAKLIIKNLKDKGIDTSLISFDQKKSSGLSFIVNNKKDRIIFTYRGANDSLVISSRQAAIIKKAEWTYLSSLPLKPKSNLEVIFKNKNKIAWNPGLSQLSKGFSFLASFLKNTDIFIVNKDEALEIITKSQGFSHFTNDFLNRPRNLVKILKEQGPDKIILTDGTKGAYFFDGSNFHHQGIIKNQNRVDSTGVGDAFASTVVATLFKYQGDYKKAMYLGVKNVTSMISQPGAQNGLLKLKDLIK